MKDRIGQSSSRKKKNTESDFSNVTGVPKPDNYGGFSPDDDGMPPKKKSKLPIILCGLLAVAVVAGGGWFLLSATEEAMSCSSRHSLRWNIR